MTETIARTAAPVAPAPAPDPEASTPVPDPEASAPAADAPVIGGRARIRVGIIGATGYVGGEMVRLLDQHPNVRSRGAPRPQPGPGAGGHDASPPGQDRIRGRRRAAGRGGRVPGAAARPGRGAGARPRRGGATGHRSGPRLPAARSGRLSPLVRLRASRAGPARERRIRHAGAAPRGAGGAARSSDVAIVGAPGCYPTATILALAPLARAGLIADLVVDAKSGVSGAGREPKPELAFSEVNESVKAYGIGGHRHVAEMEQELGLLSPSAGRQPGRPDHRLPAPPHPHDPGHPVRRARPADPPGDPGGAATTCTRETYRGEPFVQVTETPPATSTSRAATTSRVFVTADERTGRILAIGRHRQPGEGCRRPGASRRSTWSSACRRRPGWSSDRSLPDGRMTAPHARGSARSTQAPTLPTCRARRPCCPLRGFRAGAATAGVKKSGRARPVGGARRRTAPAPRPPRSPPTASPPPRSC